MPNTEILINAHCGGVYVPMLFSRANGAELRVTADYKILLNGRGVSNPERVTTFLVAFAKELAAVQPEPIEPAKPKHKFNWLRMLLSTAIPMLPKLLKK